HYLRRARDEKYFGLGERAGDMDRAGQCYRLTNIDAMGYSARTSDPLYKHIPFYITCRPEAGLAFGLSYDTLSDCVFDFGKELDNYHGPYRYFAADHRDLDYYIIAGPRVAQVTRQFTWLTGRPAFTPKWGLGYSGSTMAYTEAPDAQARMSEFLERCAEHDILYDSFHLSSGYTSVGDKRHVFNWNRSKFPDPAAFARAFAEKGVQLCANVKPCLLRDNPLFEEARALGILVASAAGEPSFAQFWGDLGAYLDFTNPETIRWWQAKIRESLLDYGIAAIWNDNNEFEILSPDALAHNFGEARRAREMKPLQSLQMTRLSVKLSIQPGETASVSPSNEESGSRGGGMSRDDGGGVRSAITGVFSMSGGGDKISWDGGRIGAADTGTGMGVATGTTGSAGTSTSGGLGRTEESFKSGGRAWGNSGGAAGGKGNRDSADEGSGDGGSEGCAGAGGGSTD